MCRPAGRAIVGDESFGPPAGRPKPVGVNALVSPIHLIGLTNVARQSITLCFAGSPANGQKTISYISLLKACFILLIGAIAGWLAGQIVQGTGFGLIGDIVIGIVGAFIASLLFPRLGHSFRCRNCQ